VITGEGKIDGQSAHGKTPVGVARAAKRHGVPVVAVAAILGAGYESVYREGIDACFAIADGPITREESMKRAGELLEKTGENVMRLFVKKLEGRD
jgi:glycerate kinase